MRKLIGLAGKARSGKDTAAARLVYSHRFTQTAFADPIRRAVAAMLDMSHGQLFTDQNKDKPISPEWPQHITPRFLMQTLGTEWGRNIVTSDLWLRVVQRYWETSYAQNIVVSDVRFDNEAQWIRSVPGGVVWHIWRHVPDTVHNSGHQSEAGVGVLSGDVVIDNNGSIHNLYDQIDSLVKKMG